ncbi:MAG: PIN domain-containing protein [Candidatus Omnitrophota bacterium]
MSKYVIDANILFGAIISTRRIYLEILRTHELYAPDFSLKEIEKYEGLFLKKTKIKKEELNFFLIKLFEGITILPSILIGQESKQRALDLCKDIDEKDTPYVALSIELDIPLITNDKKLYRGLKGKGFSDVFLFEELIKSF